MRPLLYDISVSVSRELYDREVVLKTAYIFTEKAYLHIESNEENWIIHMKMKPGMETVSPAEFENALISEMVRLSVYRRTHTLRELLMGKALSTSVIEHDNPIREIAGEQETSQEELQDILQDWFEKNEK